MCQNQKNTLIKHIIYTSYNEKIKKGGLKMKTNNRLTTEELIGTIHDFQNHEYLKLITGESDVYDYVRNLFELDRWVKKVIRNNQVEGF